MSPCEWCHSSPVVRVDRVGNLSPGARHGAHDLTLVICGGRTRYGYDAQTDEIPETLLALGDPRTGDDVVGGRDGFDAAPDDPADR